jgi:hypothetical protein
MRKLLLTLILTFVTPVGVFGTYLKKILDDVKDWVAKNKKSRIQEYSWNADKQIFEEKPGPFKATNSLFSPEEIRGALLAVAAWSQDLGRA